MTFRAPEFPSELLASYTSQRKFCDKCQEPTARYPRESGVVYTKWGTVAAGAVLYGVLSGYSPYTRDLKYLVCEKETCPEDLTAEMQRKRVTNQWVPLAGKYKKPVAEKAHKSTIATQSSVLES